MNNILIDSIHTTHCDDVAVPILRRNKMRIAEVWMDDYKHLFHVAMGKRNLVNTKYTKSLQ